MNGQRYIQILQFLETYGGEKYKKIDKCKSDEEKTYMLQGAEKGKESRACFEEIVKEIGVQCELEYGKITQWQNSGNFVRYFWCQLKAEDYLDSNISISVFAESSSEGLRFRVSVELAVDKASSNEKDAYKQILNMPLKKGLVYISGGNNEDEFRLLDIYDNNEVKKLNLKKVQVSFIVNKEDCRDDGDVLDGLIRGATDLLEYYNYAIEVGDITKKKPEVGSTTGSDKWTPTIHEYNPSISKEKWLELLPDLAEPVWGGVLAMFYTEKDGVTCSTLAEKYGMQPMEISGRCTNLAKCVHKETSCSLYSKGGKEQYWFILFFRKDAAAGEKGNYAWKLRPELYDALTEFDILRFLPKSGIVDKEPPKYNLSPKETVDHLKSYIASKGFSYEGNLIENFYLSLKSKPFTILAGTSGTGKTKLVKLFAEAVGANEANGRYKMVSVRPDWSDGSDLFGHTDLNGNFVEGPVCSAFDAAMNESDKPVFLCLDEMNLARVEYYLSDFLSVIESRERGDDGKITTSAIAQYENGIPDNLYLVGTVNMDETTFPFSKKVLDRANTIEFNYVELIPKFEETLSSVEPLDVPNRFLQTEYLVLERDCADEQDYVTQICDKLQQINEILRKANAHVGYRVRDEIVFYMLNNKKAGNLLTEEQAFDNEIMQKILPRIQGSAVSIKDMLIELFKFCMGDQAGVDQDNGNVSKQMENKADSATYKESAKKIGYMMKRYEEDGFTSYWL